MIWNDVQAQWPVFVPRLRTRWPELDEVELLSTDGDRARVAELVARAAATDTPGAQDMLARWLDGPAPADTMTDPLQDNARISASHRDIAAGEEPLHDDEAFGDDNTPQPPIGRTD